MSKTPSDATRISRALVEIQKALITITLAMDQLMELMMEMEDKEKESK